MLQFLISLIAALAPTPLATRKFSKARIFYTTKITRSSITIDHSASSSRRTTPREVIGFWLLELVLVHPPLSVFFAFTSCHRRLTFTRFIPQLTIAKASGGPSGAIVIYYDFNGKKYYLAITGTSVIGRLDSPYSWILEQGSNQRYLYVKSQYLSCQC
jgi:hypothetical protein